MCISEMTKVHVPSSLHEYTKGQEVVEVEGTTVREIVESLDTAYGLGKRLIGSEGILRYVNIYLGDDDIRFLEGLDTEVENLDVVIVPAMSGGF